MAKGEGKTGPKPAKHTKPKSSKPSPTDDTIALYAHLMIGQQGRVKAEQRAQAAIVKQAGQNGVDWKTVKDCMKEYELPAEVRLAKAKQQAVVFNALGIPAQLEMFDAYVPKVNDTEAEAARKGRFAAICHGACEPPYPPGSKEGQAWIEAWHSVMRLVSQYDSRLVNKAPADKSGDDDWGGEGDKPVPSVDALKTEVDHNPDAPTPPAEAPAAAEPPAGK